MPTEISVFLLSLQAMPLKLTTYYRGSKVPDLPGTNTFHSTELFRIYEETPGYTPILIVASEDDKPVAKLLAAIRKSVRMFPPGIIKRCEVYGTGEYFNNEADKEIIFSDMLQRLTNEALRDSFLIEFRNLENAMFGYKSFRDNQYIAINWLRVRNSLHGDVYKRQRIFFQDTAPLPQHQVLSASRKPVDKRAAKQNLHRHL